MKKFWKNLWWIKKIDENETEELRKICNHYFDKKKRNHEKNYFFVEVKLGDVMSNASISPEKIAKL